MTTKIYIAGFDVFSPEAIAIGEKYKTLCAKYGCQGLYPLDGTSKMVDDYAPEEKAHVIFCENLKKIDTADVVIANINNFRGLCLDDGTAFEIGYAFREGKRIIGYINDKRPLVDRIGPQDEVGYKVEDFGQPVNLMIACATEIIQGDFEDCLEVLFNEPDEDSEADVL